MQTQNKCVNTLAKGILCSAFQNLRRVPPRIFIYVQNVPRLFGARHFSLFFFSVWPQFLVNRASSPGTLKIAILGQSMGVQLSRQQTRVVVKHRAFSLAPLKLSQVPSLVSITESFFFNKKIYRWLLICTLFIHVYCIQKALWSFLTDLCHEILGEGELGSFMQPGSSDQE